ncbi:type II toxin-antitoxin system RelE/ParE family toxin [Desulfonatronum thioautotrophicum]|uniref:type II toxin-antitoxin system RelE/ParE family toxin n=1 Tax=Desulfonatronum thioautotrophicum TaxID=617001 RepID=UPI00307D29D8
MLSRHGRVIKKSALGWQQLQGLDGPPEGVRRFFGHALFLAQCGEKHEAAKVLKGFGGAGVIEILESDEGGTYRAVYTVNFKDFVVVLHCFQKKSKSGIRTPKADIDLIRARLKMAEDIAMRC